MPDLGHSETSAIIVSREVRGRIYFRCEQPGTVSLYVEGEPVARLSVAAAEDLQLNLAINAEAARGRVA